MCTGSASWIEPSHQVTHDGNMTIITVGLPGVDGMNNVDLDMAPSRLR